MVEDYQNSPGSRHEWLVSFKRAPSSTIVRPMRKAVVASVVVALTALLLMVAFIGEAIREAFDPKTYAYYE